jgi:hypothetical protein
MQVEPAHVDQLRAAKHGGMVLIDADAGGVAADLKAIDPGLKVRFAETATNPFFAVYWESEDRRETQLILTVQAHKTVSGTWGGLDQRVVDRIREIDSQGRSGYNFADEVEKQTRRAHDEHRQRFRERAGEIGEQAAHAVRKDLGSKKRAFIDRKPGQ